MFQSYLTILLHFKCEHTRCIPLTVKKYNLCSYHYENSQGDLGGKRPRKGALSGQQKPKVSLQNPC